MWFSSTMQYPQMTIFSHFQECSFDTHLIRDWYLWDNTQTVAAWHMWQCLQNTNAIAWIAATSCTWTWWTEEADLNATFRNTRQWQMYSRYIAGLTIPRILLRWTCWTRGTVQKSIHKPTCLHKELCTGNRVSLRSLSHELQESHKQFKNQM